MPHDPAVELERLRGDVQTLQDRVAQALYVAEQHGSEHADLGRDPIIGSEVAGHTHTAVAYPAVAATATSTDSSSPFTVTLPSGIVSGNLLIVFFAWNSGTITWPAGWTQFFTQTGTNTRLAGAYRQADGTEGTSISVTGTATATAHNSYRITGHVDPATQAPEAATSIGSGNADPSALSPTGGRKDYLWLAAAGPEDGAGAVPGSYTDLLSASVGAVGCLSARRNLTTDLENPAVFAGTSGAWAAATVAIHPTAGSGVGSHSHSHDTELTGVSADDHHTESHAHSTHTALASDDHTQYPLLAGRAGGQTLIGGTAAGNSLTLRGQSLVTNRDIVIADTGDILRLAGVTDSAGLLLTSLVNLDTASIRLVDTAVAGDAHLHLRASDGQIRFLPNGATARGVGIDASGFTGATLSFLGTGTNPTIFGNSVAGTSSLLLTAGSSGTELALDAGGAAGSESITLRVEGIDVITLLTIAGTQFFQSIGWIPAADATYDFGSSTRRWKDGYFSGVIRSASAPTSIQVGGSVTVGADAAANTSSSIDLQATNRAFLINRLTTTQRDALTPANGMGIYNTTLAKFQVYEAGAWVNMVGPTIHDEVAAGLPARNDLHILGAGAFAQDNAGAARTEIIVPAYYDAVVDTNDTNAKGKGNVYDTLQLAIDAGHTSIFVRAMGDVAARDQLNAAIDDVVATITVDSTAGFPSAGHLLIDDEIILYTAINATQFLGGGRGQKGTAAASHLDNAKVGTAIGIAPGDAVRLIVGEEPVSAVSPVHISSQKADLAIQFLQFTTQDADTTQLVIQGTRNTIFGCAFALLGQLRFTGNGDNSVCIASRFVACSGTPVNLSPGADNIAITSSFFVANTGANCIFLDLTGTSINGFGLVGCRFLSNTCTGFLVDGTSGATSANGLQINGNLFSGFNNGAVRLFAFQPNVSGNVFDGTAGAGGGEFSTQVAIDNQGSGSFSGAAISGCTFRNTDIILKVVVGNAGRGTLFSNNALANTTFVNKTLQETLTAVDVAADDIITLNNTTGIPASGSFSIADEIFGYTGISGNDVTGCTRARKLTTIAAHAINDQVRFHLGGIVLMGLNTLILNCSGSAIKFDGQAEPAGGDENIIQGGFLLNCGYANMTNPIIRNVWDANGTPPVGYKRLLDIGPFGGRSYVGKQLGAVLVNGANQNVTVPETGFLRITGPTAAFNIGGLTGGEDGRVLYIYNASLQAMTINHLDAGSTAANQIVTPSAVNEARGLSVELIYSAADARWVLLS